MRYLISVLENQLANFGNVYQWYFFNTFDVFDCMPNLQCTGHNGFPQAQRECKIAIFTYLGTPFALPNNSLQ